MVNAKKCQFRDGTLQKTIFQRRGSFLAVLRRKKALTPRRFSTPTRHAPPPTHASSQQKSLAAVVPLRCSFPQLWRGTREATRSRRPFAQMWSNATPRRRSRSRAVEVPRPTIVPPPSASNRSQARSRRGGGVLARGAPPPTPQLKNAPRAISVHALKEIILCEGPHSTLSATTSCGALAREHVSRCAWSFVSGPRKKRKG